MIEIYEEKDFENAYKLKNKLLTAYFTVLAAVVVAVAVVFVVFLQLPYASTEALTAKKNGYLTTNCVITVLFIIFSFIFLGIPYKRAKAYFRLLQDIKAGQKVLNEATFLQNEDDIHNVRNVDFRYAVVLEWSEKTQEYMRRNVLVDKEKKMPELKNGDIIRFITHANVLLSYSLKKDDEVFDIFGKSDGKE